MIFSLGVLRRFIFGLSNQHGRFSVRGFPSTQAQQRLELVGRTVIETYNTALEEGCTEGLEVRLRAMDNELHGFACEGAAMGLFILDKVVPFANGHFARFLEGHGKNHRYMSYIGAGLGAGAFGLSYRKVLAEHHHFSKLLFMDGYGFYKGFFKTEPTVRRQEIPADILNDAALRERFDSGLGRALWFADGGDPARLRATVDKFAPERRPELWAGIGLAATYACGVDKETLQKLLSLGSDHRLMMAQGSLLACHARHKAGNPAPHNDLAAGVLAGCDGARLHAIAVDRLKQINEDSDTTGDKNTWTLWIEMVRSDLGKMLAGGPSTSHSSAAPMRVAAEQISSFTH